METLLTAPPALPVSPALGQSGRLIVLTGEEAIACLRSKDFRARWISLYEGCPWKTACQHPDFVLPWYELYRDRYLPVVVFSRVGDQNLTGLLTMAFIGTQNRLVGAGERQAEYQCWLAAPENGNSFMQCAVRRLQEDLPGASLCLRFLPPGAPLLWLESDADIRERGNLIEHRRPLIDIDAEAMDRQRRKKNHRQNFNRLARLGEVRYEHIDDPEAMPPIIDELCLQYDFRQGALHRDMPFSGDPAKKRFLLELHRRGLLHTSALTVGGNIAATHSGLITGKEAVHLSIITHSPFFAMHSPGQLLLAMLGVQLAEEGIRLLDLTPGQETYKENFATRFDTVLELSVFAEKAARFKHQAVAAGIRMLKSGMQGAGISTVAAREAIGRLGQFRQAGLCAVATGMRLPEPRLYRHDGSAPSCQAPSVAIAKDNLADLFRFDSSGSLRTRSDFLRAASLRLERSNHFYTLVRDDKLLACCWTGNASSTAALLPASSLRGLPQEASLLFDLYVSPRAGGESLVRDFIGQVLSDLSTDCESQPAYLLSALEPGVGTVVRECGFAGFAADTTR